MHRFLFLFLHTDLVRDEAADNENLHKNSNNTAGNNGKVLQLVEKNLFSWSFDGDMFICSVFNISQLFEK